MILDIESLELLEAALQDYSGTLLLVSHDRAFLDNVVTSVLAAEGEKARAKLSYKEQRELESLPGKIEALEAEQKALEQKMSAGDYYKLGAEEVKRDRKRAEEIEGELMRKLERWEELEGRAAE